MESQKYKGAWFRVYRVVIPIALITFVVSTVVSFHFTGVDVMNPSMPEDMTWHILMVPAIIALTITAVVGGSLRAYIITRLPCPRCMTRDTKWKYQKSFLIICPACEISWDTGLKMSSSSGSDHPHDPGMDQLHH